LFFFIAKFMILTNVHIIPILNNIALKT
jgi:hypothetical protein